MEKSWPMERRGGTVGYIFQGGGREVNSLVDYLVPAALVFQGLPLFHMASTS